ncbi:zinc-dependent alcohol dehydrogenase family protein [Neptunicoccus cionae]|uniref:zinc-dependent alcohol dehydrogenase family protein n=1 Tax=Neptunicoccus cionae TaxID=2035344 RepID=UPI000C7669F9|nr:zinc-dependent alcohol dehydrogenase family protein [Amylibacter cionae]PLS21226.1 quinone oxidoreductase [Amylibacter cionae]
MKAMALSEYGPEAPFAQIDLPKPTAGAGQVIVRIEATSVNTIDTMIRNMGTDLGFAPKAPAVLGMDFAGTIEEIGAGVTDFAVGDEVYGCAGGLADLQGALAEYMPADARLIAKKPISLSMREAAAIPLVGITAYEGLKRAGVTGGQKVLVHGGSGGVGHIGVQLAQAFGAEVYATDGGEERLSVVRELGAEAIDFKAETVEDYVAKHTDGAGFDAVLDTVGAANLTNSFNAVALNGHVATTLALAELDLSPAHLKGASLHVVFMLIPMLHDKDRAEHGAILAELARLVDNGALKPIVDAPRFTLEEVGAAYARLSSGKAIGKVVIEV